MDIRGDEIEMDGAGTASHERYAGLPMCPPYPTD